MYAGDNRNVLDTLKL